MLGKAPKDTCDEELDVQISAIQLMMLGLGAMSVYTGTWKSDVMSWVLLLLTVSIFVVPAFIMLLEGMQWPSINQSPGS